MPLSMLGKGNEGIIQRYHLKDMLKKHFEDLGLLPGVKVKIDSEINGNVIIAIKDKKLAINKGVAQKFIVSAC